MKTMNHFLILLFCGLATCVHVPIKIYTDTPMAVVDSRFLSVTMDSAVFHNFRRSPFVSKKALMLAKTLTGGENRPEFYLRIGGSDADHTTFDPKNYIMNITEFEDICHFVNTLRWILIFDLNSLQRYSDGSWDPSNAVELIDFATKHGYYVQYELGNEPDLYPTHLNITVQPEQLAMDFKTLREILNVKTRNQAMLIGPDVATLNRYNYFGRFMAHVEEGVLDAVTFHHYYSSSDNITAENFTSVVYLDRFLHYCETAFSIIESSFKTFPHPPVWIGETSSTYGGGNPNVGESFASGFVWLDKLGLAAQFNISVVLRQSLKGGHYSLLNKEFDPNPDYWSTLLYKQLVGRTVLNVTGYLMHNRQVRVYAHCVNRFGGRGYQRSNVVTIILNVNPKKTAEIEFLNEFASLDLDQYLFSPYNGKLTDREVQLNGKLLKVENDTVPVLKPIRVKQPLKVPPLTYGFFVIRDSYAVACDKD